MTRPADVRDCLADAAGRLAAAGVADPWREARLLLSHAAGIAPATLIGYPERPVRDRSTYDRLVARRAAREPLSHILGRREFWSLDFAVTRDTLDPRPDSETLVEAALDGIADRNAALRIVDFGTGTGCLLGALLVELPAATGIGVDRDPAAAAVARRNLDALGLSDRADVVVGDWGRALTGDFDLIIANPPYIPGAEIATLQPEVARFEPRAALCGGPDGLAAFRALVPQMPGLLRAGGVAVIEFGAGQESSVAAIVAGAGLRVRATRRDLAGRPRCLVCILATDAGFRD